MEPAKFPYYFIGGIAAVAYGRRRFTHDIDIFVSFDDADETLNYFRAGGFRTEETNLEWIYKAFTRLDGKDPVIDILFKTMGEIFVDEEMIHRARSFNLKAAFCRFSLPKIF